MRNFFLLYFLFGFIACTQQIPKKAYQTIQIEQSVSNQGERLKVGFSAVEITPGYFVNESMRAEQSHSHINLAGYRFGRKALSVHDPLWARVLFLQQGQTRLAIVTLDLIGLPYDELQAIRKSMPQELKDVFVVINTTHTHHGTDTLGFWGHGLKSNVRKEYSKFLQTKIIDAISLASNSTSETTLYFGQESIKNLGLVQDLRPPFVYPDFLSTLQFRNQDKILGTVVHWECHPESLAHNNTAISSDFPHYLRTELEALTKAPVIYWNGAIGGLLVPASQIVYQENVIKQGSFLFMEALGRTLGEAAFDISKESQKISTDILKYSVEKFQVSVSNVLFKLGAFFGIIKRKIFSHRYIASEMAAIRIGELSLQTIPGEPFPELIYGPLDPPANADKPNAEREEPVIIEMMKTRYRLVLGLAQDELGYIIPRNGWDQRRPFLGKGKMASLGEEMSPGKKFSFIIHEIAETLNKRLNNE